MSDETSAQTSSAQPSSSGSRRARRRGWRFKLAAILLGLSPFVVLEAGLRIFDVARPSEQLDPFFGFGKLHPQFSKDADGGKYVTTKSRRLFFGTQEFAAKKPANGFRAFCLGGSTVRGRPYTTESAFAKWMQVELADGDPDTPYEIVNCGGLSYASYRLMPILREVLKYDPDLIVIAAGHNEFLEDRSYRDLKQRSAARTWIEGRLHSLRTVHVARRLWVKATGKTDERVDLPEELKTRLDNQSGYASYHRDPAWRKDIIAHYDRSLRKMVAMCNEAKVPVVLVRLGANIRDCPPFKSEHKTGLSAEAQRQWQQHFDDATAAESTDFRKALALYKKAEAIDDQHALLCYRMARCFDRMGNAVPAAYYYRRAKDQDICPVRILDAMADLVKTVARDTNTPTVDAKTLFESKSPQGIPGNNFFVDHVHPTIEAHQQIAQRVVQAVHAKGWLAKSYKPRTQGQLRAAYRRHFRALGDTFISGAGQRVKWVEGWAQRDRLRKETRPVDVRGRLDYGYRWYELGDQQKAWQEFGALLNDDPATANKLLGLARKYFNQGRLAAARDILEKLRPRGTPELAARITLARLIVSLDTGDKRGVLELLRASGDDLARIADDDPWLKLIPDALERARRLAKP